ncbi:MAG: TrmH family RNA methyltransferase [Bacteroidia bacterium]
MLSKNQVKFINALKLKKNRESEGLFVAEGVKIVNELLHSGIKVRQIYSSRNYQLSIFNYHIEVVRIKESELKRISSLHSPNEVLAICEIPVHTLDIVLLRNKLCLLLDTIQDPGNLGTMIRIADWFGIEHIICSPDTVEVYNPKVVQATMGSISRVQVHYTPLEPFLEGVCKQPGTRVYGALLEGEELYKAELSDEGFILIGNESKGISSEFLPYITDKIRIPLFSPAGREVSGQLNAAESLNAAIATSVICAEFRRRTSAKS